MELPIIGREYTKVRGEPIGRTGARLGFPYGARMSQVHVRKRYRTRQILMVDAAG
jgi:hypothetical protein